VGWLSVLSVAKEFPLEGLPSDMPDIAFSSAAPMEGGPFVTVPSTANAKIANRALIHQNYKMTGFTRLASSADVEAPLSGAVYCTLGDMSPLHFLIEQCRLAVARSAGKGCASLPFTGITCG
jgi:hypothetical protein